MRRSLLTTLYLLCAAGVSAVALTACAANSSNGALTAVETSQAAVAPFGQAAIQNDAGQFSGTVKDSAFSKPGPASGSLAQDEQAVGGMLTVKFAGGFTIVYSFAAQTTNGTTLAGSEVADTPVGVCSYSVNATYNATTHVLTGTFQAVHRCTGESGSFSLKKQCFYPLKGLLEVVPALNHNPSAKPNGLHPC